VSRSRSRRGPDSFLGEIETWESRRGGAQGGDPHNGFPLKLKEKDGTFYGPKIDYQVTDALGRQFQTATIQLDYQLPQQFDLKYVGADNTEHVPVVIHRAIYGSFERFIAILIEHYAGAFPTWLAPVQCRVLTVSAASRLRRGGDERRCGRAACASSSTRTRAPSTPRCGPRRWRRSPTR